MLSAPNKCVVPRYLHRSILERHQKQLQFTLYDIIRGQLHIHRTRGRPARADSGSTLDEYCKVMIRILSTFQRFGVILADIETFLTKFIVI